MLVRDAEPKDIPAILALYNHAVRETTAAWTTQEETLDARLTWYEGRMKQGLPVIVAADEEDQVAGFASYGPFRAKEGYRYTAEHTVYVDPARQRQGIGRTLMTRLIEIAEANGIHVLVGGVDGDNGASIALHQSLGFEVSGRLPQTGTKFERWLDLVFLTKVLNVSGSPAE
ncbi:MAG: N-acetyltransferase [Roseibium sp.]|uniref:GNAT family N-acetyltransferase n=1 Tax=Roseibium sp. TaxID=1936156 RepID=UPI001B0188F9|nr:GNAT family N-acetyltransferase [Roseibium sp.]MBO6511485.1 N-acetyltransferase [Roseibium sp.]MBO6890320.1 N-acetyltransferase [Roseibium sp.]MBO6932654.1 N-acetyltransferase [Roseibium sp.]